MKKRIISLIMVIVLALSMLSTIPVTANAVSSDEAKLYEPVVEKILDSVVASFSEEFANHFAEGILYDLDNDGTEELVLSYPQKKDQQWVWYYAYSIYDVEQGKLVAKAENVATGATDAVAGCGGFIGVALYNGEPVLITCQEGGETSRGEGYKYPKWECTVEVYSYDELQLIKTVEAQTTHEEILYAVDGKRISEEEFQKEMNRFKYLEFGIQNNIWIYFRNTVERLPMNELLGSLKKLSPEKPGDTAKPAKRLAKIIQTTPGYEDIEEYTFTYNEWNLLECVYYEDSFGYEFSQEFVYDEDGRFIRYRNSEENVYTYDSSGRLIKYVKREGDMASTYTYFYNSDGKLERSVCDGWGGWSESETTNYFYDKNGRLERMQNDSGTEYYTYDSLGRLQKKENDYNTTTYSYAADGSLKLAYIEQNHPTMEITSSLYYDFKNHAPFIVVHGEGTGSGLWIEDTAGHTVWSLDNTRSSAYTGELVFETDANGLVISAKDDVWEWEFVYEILDEEINEETKEETPNPREAFCLEENSWTFLNWNKSFAREPANHADEYFIPRERYDEVFGSAYVDSMNMFTEDWNGSCAGMATTAILFFMDRLQWESIDEVYPGTTENPNDFFGSVIYDHINRGYYAAIGPDTEVTRLIEAYQLYMNEIDMSKLGRNLLGTYYEADPEIRTRYGVTNDEKPICIQERVYNHIPASEGGTYIASALKDFQEAYENNIPLWIGLQYNQAGHIIVSRTDLEPEDMGDGWWRVYVYDPNKPYINDDFRSLVGNEEMNPTYLYSCNAVIDNGGDIFMELNPSLNQWRYCTSVNSSRPEVYIGSTPDGNLSWKGMEKKDDLGNEYLEMRPDYFITVDLTDLAMEDFAHPYFDSTNAWIPENDLVIVVDSSTDCTIYDSTGELAAIVDDGETLVLCDTGSYSPRFGQNADGSALGGKIYLPTDMYTVQYSSGNIHFLGNDNVISVSCEGAAVLTVDIASNSIQTVAKDNVVATIKCANVLSSNECSYVDTEGALAAGETFTMSYSDESKVEVSTDSKDGKFQINQKKADWKEAVVTKVVKAQSSQWKWIACAAVVCLLVVLLISSKAMRKLLLRV